LAMLAASTAFAQSSVTLYGVADAWLGQTSVTISPGAAVKQIKLDSGGYNGSRWGLRGSEDLGGGLKANFQLESGFNIDSGGFASNSAGGIFGRQAYVGLSGGFGAINFGRQYTAYDDARGAENANNGFDTAFTPTGTVYGRGSTTTVGVLTGVADYTSRTNNTIKYNTPDFGGVSGALSYALGEDKTAAASASSVLGAHLKYVNGPIAVFAALQNEKPAGTGDKTQFANIGANYDLGVVRLSAGYQNAKLGTTKDNEFQAGVAVPFGPAAISAGFATTQTKVNGAKAGKGTGFGLTGYYDLSKRTAAYAGVRSAKFEDAGGNTTSKDSLFAVGVRHRF
jgi:predicted porin